MTTRRVRIPHYAIVKAPGLLCMLYTVSELSTLLRVPDRTLRDWLSMGAPHTRDARGHLWINGIEFATWIKSQRKPQRTRKLERNQAYCLRCNQVVEMIDPKVFRIKGKLVHVRGKCPVCGCTINRGDRLAESVSGITSANDQHLRAA